MGVEVFLGRLKTNLSKVPQYYNNEIFLGDVANNLLIHVFEIIFQPEKGSSTFWLIIIRYTLNS